MYIVNYQQMSIKRLETERGDLEKVGFKVVKKTETNWEITIAGPKDSPFQNGHFTLNLTLENFPFKAPEITFKTQIYHPNVDAEKGIVCKDMIETGDKWAPTKRLTKCLELILAMMVNPNMDTPMNEKAAQDFKNGTWEKKAKEAT